MKQIWLEPDYFDRFACKCGACRQTCCSGWEIAISMKEYYKLIGMDCSEELHGKLERAFRVPELPTEEVFRFISPNWQGDCPLLSSNGLCSLQLECGEEALAEVCRMYPRSLKAENGLHTACCSASCEAVVELLMAEDNVTFVRREMEARTEISEVHDKDMDFVERVLTEILQDRSLPLRNRLIKFHDEIHPDKVFDAEAAADSSGLIDGLREILTLIRTLSPESRYLEQVASAVLDRYDREGGDAAYERDAETFERLYPQWSRYFENILVNNILYSAAPYADSRLSVAGHSAGVLAQYGLLRVLCAANTAESPSPENLVDTISGLYHLVEHTAFYYNAKVLIRDEAALLYL